MYGHVIAKFSGMGSLPHFLTDGAPLRARELRYHSATCSVMPIRGYTRGRRDWDRAWVNISNDPLTKKKELYYKYYLQL